MYALCMLEYMHDLLTQPYSRGHMSKIIFSGGIIKTFSTLQRGHQ